MDEHVDLDRCDDRARAHPNTIMPRICTCVDTDRRVLED